MAHLKKSATTGHLLKTGTGHLSKACPAGVLCFCPGGTARITVSGSTTRTSCGLYFVSSYSKASAALDGTYDLSLTSESGLGCVYELTTSITYSLYSDPSCTTATAGPYTCAWRLDVNSITGQVVLVCGAGSYPSTLFNSSGSYNITDCASIDVSNDNTASNFMLAYGGSANIVFL